MEITLKWLQTALNKFQYNLYSLTPERQNINHIEMIPNCYIDYNTVEPV